MQALLPLGRGHITANPPPHPNPPPHQRIGAVPGQRSQLGLCNLFITLNIAVVESVAVHLAVKRDWHILEQGAYTEVMQPPVDAHT